MAVNSSEINYICSNQKIADLGIIETIAGFDKSLFRKINGDWHNSAFDNIFPLLRESRFWIPVYLFLLLFALVNYRKHGLYWCIFLILTALLSDIISSRVIKEIFFRLRPCRDPELLDHLRFMVKYCPMSSGFTSSHAVSHFGLATYIFTTFRPLLGKWWPVLFIWAASICYAQVYVGVHYPLDVCCGAILGIFIGYLCGKFFSSKIGLEN